MADNLLASLTELLTPDLIGQASSALGEPAPSVSKGLGVAFPLILGSLASRAGEPGFAPKLFELVDDPANDRGLLDDVGRLLGAGAAALPVMALGGRLLESLFGNNLGRLSDSLGSVAGVKPSSASSMLGFAAPLVLSLLGRRARSGNLNAGALASLLAGQIDAYKAAVPGPLTQLERYFATPEAPRHVVAPAPPPERKSSIWRWLLPLLIVLAVLWLLSRCMGGREETATQTTPAAAPPVETVPLPAPVVEPAPAGTPMANFYFEVDQFELPVAREGSLEAVIEYLKANTGAVASISGYHDPSGDREYNEDLARRRAQAVQDALLAAGVSESQIDLVKPVETTGSGDMAEARRVEVAIRR